MPDVAPAAHTNIASGAAEFSVNNRDLLKELSGLQRVVPCKSTVPILVNIHMQATANALFLTASDVDLSLRTACPAKVKNEDGS
jgi:DNA polymerase-3 subunit beta